MRARIVGELEDIGFAGVERRVRLSNAVDDACRRAIGKEGQQLDLAAQRHDQRCLGQRLDRVVAAFHEQIGADRFDQT